MDLFPASNKDTLHPLLTETQKTEDEDKSDIPEKKVINRSQRITNISNTISAFIIIFSLDGRQLQRCLCIAAMLKVNSQKYIQIILTMYNDSQTSRFLKKPHVQLLEDALQ